MPKKAEILCEENEFAQMCELMRIVDNAEDMLSNNNVTFTVFAPVIHLTKTMDRCL